MGVQSNILLNNLLYDSIYEDNYNKKKYYLDNLFDMLGLIINKKINHINNYSHEQPSSNNNY